MWQIESMCFKEYIVLRFINIDSNERHECSLQQFAKSKPTWWRELRPENLLQLGAWMMRETDGYEVPLLA